MVRLALVTVQVALIHKDIHKNRIRTGNLAQFVSPRILTLSCLVISTMTCSVSHNKDSSRHLLEDGQPSNQLQLISIGTLLSLPVVTSLKNIFQRQICRNNASSIAKKLWKVFNHLSSRLGKILLRMWCETNIKMPSCFFSRIFQRLQDIILGAPWLFLQIFVFICIIMTLYYF